MKFVFTLIIAGLTACAKQQDLPPQRQSNCILQLYHEYAGNFSYRIKTDTSIWFHDVDDKFFALWQSWPRTDTICLNLVTENFFYTNHKH